jgi:hypothetical protein
MLDAFIDRTLLVVLQNLHDDSVPVAGTGSDCGKEDVPCLPRSGVVG